MQKPKFLSSLAKLKLQYKLPNVITALRIFFAPFVLISILYNQRQIALVLLCFLSFSDWADGFLARVLKSETKVGQILDPLADKLLIFCVSIGVLYKGMLPLWLVAAFFLRDFLLILGSGALLQKENIIPPLIISKINTFLQFFLFILVLQDFFYISTFFFYIICFITLFTTLLSGYFYGKTFFSSYSK